MECTIKNKKLLKIRNSDITVDMTTDNEYVYMKIYIGSLIQPAERPRTSNKFSGMYDPLGSYKKTISRKIIKQLDDNFKPCEGEVSIKLQLNIVPPISWSKKKRLYAIQGRLKPISKPDNDNTEKTLYDSLNGVLWLDDSQITENYTRKDYSTNESSIIEIKMTKESANINGRMTKDEVELYKEIFKKEGEKVND